MTQFFFVDESGDPGLEGQAGSSSHFVITMVQLPARVSLRPLVNLRKALSTGLPTNVSILTSSTDNVTQDSLPQSTADPFFVPTPNSDGYLFSEDFDKKPNWNLSGTNFSIRNGQAVAENGSIGTPFIGNNEWKNYLINLKMDCFDCKAVTIYVRAKDQNNYMAYTCLELGDGIYQDKYSCSWNRTIEGKMIEITTTTHTFNYIWDIFPISIEADKDSTYRTVFADGTSDIFIDMEGSYFTEGAFGLFVVGGTPAIDSIQVQNLPE
jgi:hypothetical protein